MEDGSYQRPWPRCIADTHEYLRPRPNSAAAALGLSTGCGPTLLKHHQKSKLSSSQVAGGWGINADLRSVERNLQRLTNPFDPYYVGRVQEEAVRAEAIVRREVEQCYVLEAECLFRDGLTQSQAVEFHCCFVERRRAGALLPWCSGGCMYCCMLLQDWESHLGRTYAAITDMMLQTEMDGRAALTEAFAAELGGLELYVAAAMRTSQLLAAERDALEAECMHVIAIIRMHEEQQYRALVAEKESLLTAWHDSRRLALLSEREAHTEQMVRTSIAIKETVSAQSLYSTREKEALLRRQLALLESASRSELRAAFDVRLGFLERQLWRQSNTQLLEELESLRIFKAQVEAKALQDEQDRLAAIQQSWVTEFQEIKRLKKAGPPKSGAPLPPCGRCRQVPAKDEYTHRIAECTERPVQCPKCADIFPWSQLEGHKAVCPSRVVQCAACAHYYKYSYLEAHHKRICASQTANASEGGVLAMCVSLVAACTAPTLLSAAPNVIGHAGETLVPTDDSPSSIDDTFMNRITHIDDEVLGEGSSRIAGAIATCVDRRSRAEVLDATPLAMLTTSVDVGAPKVRLTVVDTREDASTLEGVEWCAVAGYSSDPQATVDARACCLCAFLSTKRDDGGIPVSASALSAEAALSSIVSQWRSRSSVALCTSHHCALRKVVADDVAQYSKPQIEKKGKGK